MTDVRSTGSREVYRNPWIRVREDGIIRSDGSTGIYGVVEKPDFALVIPEEHGGFWLVEQFRYAVGRRSWEFPQGSWPAGHGGTPRELAVTELREETGLVADVVDHIGRAYSASGFCTQAFDVYLATGLTAGPTQREQSEQDMVHAFVSEPEFVDMIRRGDIHDAATLAAYSMLLLNRAGR